MKRTNVILISLASVFLSPGVALAANTPSPQHTFAVAPSPKSLTSSQTESIEAARVAFAVARKNALNGLDRAIADAQAIRDQAISSAGKDMSAIRTAKKNYRNSYLLIENAYRSDLKSAKSTLVRALAAIKGSSKIH